jgi:hypothetical protein
MDDQSHTHTYTHTNTDTDSHTPTDTQTHTHTHTHTKMSKDDSPFIQLKTLTFMYFMCFATHMLPGTYQMPTFF